ncbi:isotrichodermin C-15 hydroxylase [Byssothecium circinans]|uniref:Isotrichodermin C-15 hydroxylase n=1 Tax=Byssothecium circinans TaxID=147558 RepID=A0A6A5UQ13_9PLEO|nr:isotrichodermin C-15 hydroxylase [Byssothecium circinans]
MVQLNAILITIFLIILYPVYKGIYNVFFHPLSRIPGPRAWAATRLPFIRHLLTGNIVHRMEQLHHRYGPIVRIAPGEVVFAHPDAWNDILQPRAGRPPFLKDFLWWSEPGPRSIITAIDPATHARMRRTLAPAFTRTALRAQEPIIQKYVTKLIERLRERVALANSGPGHHGAVVDIFPWVNFATFDIFGDLAYGEAFNCLENSEYHPWISLIFNGIKAIAFITAVKFFPMFDWLLKKCIPPSMEKMKEAHFQHVVEKVQRRINWEVSREDIMSHTLKEAKEGKGMSLDEINHTFAGLTVAGSETTATTLGGIINYLSADAVVRKRVVDEVRSRFDDEGQITLAVVEECTYLTAVIREGLRLCAAVPWILPRVVPAGGATVCGTKLPAGTLVSIQQYALNRSAKLFHNPASFAPERWLDTAPSSPYHNDDRKAVQPFSVGPRACIGQNLAWAELRLILAGLLYAFDIEEKEGGALPWENLRTFLLVEKRPLELRLKECVS